MSRADVEARLGKPVDTAVRGKTWAYQPLVERSFFLAEIRIFVTFEDDALSDVYVDRKYTFASRPAPVLFVLNEDRTEEGAGFEETFCPAR